ncbi:MAG TPA: FMN-binding negative transcriptional regulator [Solirubrobacteraceae bacterium]|jgi:transcriptional regulator|nr:FMN-binding negative transcriptional regulator [Solirubrobacteraceae bacterium]
MYVNPHFAERELPVLHDTIEAVRFGVLVIGADGPLAAHIPFVLHRAEGRYGTLVAHVAAADPLARHLDGEHEALAIFSAPRAYVSPRWCPSGGLPTYNYMAVHAYGRPRVLADPDVVLSHLGELVDVHEARFEHPWSLASVADDYIDERLPHITAFRFEIDALQGKRKLSQNRSSEDREGIIGGLRERGGDDDLAIAATMAGYPYSSPEA